jgi:hypothetical protein
LEAMDVECDECGAPVGERCKPTCSQREPEDADVAALQARVKELEAERAALVALVAPIDGLLLYEDHAIEVFAKRTDPCPLVITGPRKWLMRIREARAALPKSVEEG